MGSVLPQSLCWPVSVKGWDPTGPRIEFGLLLVGLVCKLWDCGFLVSGVWSLVGEDGLESSASFLEGRANDYSLIGRDRP